MLDVHAAATQDLTALSPAELAELATQMLVHIAEQSKHIDAQSKRIDSQAQAIKWRDAKIESITFQLARLKAWKFGAKSERMNAAQREIFEEALAADQADLEAQLAALQQHSRPASGAAPDKQQRRQPKVPRRFEWNLTGPAESAAQADAHAVWPGQGWPLAATRRAWP